MSAQNKIYTPAAVSPDSVTVDVSERVFVRDEVHVWLPAVILSSSSTHATVSVEIPITQDESEPENGGGARTTINQERTVRLRDYPPLYKLPLQNILNDGSEEGRGDSLISSIENKEDMKDMQFYSEASVLYNLKKRHEQSSPYTRVGEIMLIAINPFMWFNELYTDEKKSGYANRIIWNPGSSAEVLPPHIYDISSKAYRSALTTSGEKNQTILVSGPSGSGKTETIKLILSHLASIQSPKKSPPLDEHFTLVKRITDTNPMFEAFGNAKTSINGNASRFVKYVKLQFVWENRSNMKLVGSLCESYLLEKTRVVHISEEESQTFHIFYQLLAASSELKEKIWPRLVQPKIMFYTDFKYLNHIDAIVNNSSTDMADKWKETEESLNCIGITGSKLETLMRAVSVVLQLGNISFTAADGDEARSNVSSQEELEALSALMGISAEDLSQAFTFRNQEIRHTLFHIPLSVRGASDSRDMLAKEIYSHIFSYLKNVSNDLTSAVVPSYTICTIAMLDFFGFEYLKDMASQFEQMCINYANERIQQRYITDSFNSVVDEYHREGIDISKFDLQDNRSIIDLFDIPLGIFSILNEECIRPGGNDSSFIYKAKSMHGEDTDEGKYLIRHKLDRAEDFGIVHFAGDILYNAHSFVQKNTDHMPRDLIELAARCPNTIIANSFAKSLEENVIKHGKSNRGFILAHSTCHKFRSQLSSLLAQMNETNNWYIRCIRPNDAKRPMYMDNSITLKQVQAAGLVAAVSLSRDTYPQSIKFEDAIHKYFFLAKKIIRAGSVNKVAADQVDSLMNAILAHLIEENDGNGKSVYLMGNTCLYLSQDAFDFLERERDIYFHKSIVLIQALIRMFIAQKMLLTSRSAAVEIQKHVRGAHDRKMYKRILDACITIQCCVRIFLAKKKLDQQRLLRMCLMVQKRWRMLLPKVSFLKLKEATIKIQKAFRRTRHKQRGASLLAQLVEEDIMRKSALLVEETLEAKAAKKAIRRKSSINDLQDAIRIVQQLSTKVRSLREENNELNEKVIHLVENQEKPKPDFVSVHAHDFMKLQADRLHSAKEARKEELFSMKIKNSLAVKSLATLNQSVIIEKDASSSLSKEVKDLRRNFAETCKNYEADIKYLQSTNAALTSQHKTSIQEAMKADRKYSNALGRLNYWKEKYNDMETSRDEVVGKVKYLEEQLDRKIGTEANGLSMLKKRYFILILVAIVVTAGYIFNMESFPVIFCSGRQYYDCVDVHTDKTESENTYVERIIKSIEYQLFIADKNPNSTVRDDQLKEWKDALNKLELTVRKLTKDTTASNEREGTTEYYVFHDVKKSIENNTSSSESGQPRTNHELSKMMTTNDEKDEVATEERPVYSTPAKRNKFGQPKQIIQKLRDAIKSRTSKIVDSFSFRGFLAATFLFIAYLNL